jgi:hypothetical protein
MKHYVIIIGLAVLAAAAAIATVALAGGSGPGRRHGARQHRVPEPISWMIDPGVSRLGSESHWVMVPPDNRTRR